MNHKTCNKCGEVKAVAEFGKDASGSDGLRSQCRSCRNIANADYRKANPEKIKAKAAKYRAENPAYMKGWFAANPEKQKANNDKWRYANPEKVKDKLAKWRAANPEAMRVHRHNRRARNAGRLSSGLAGKLFKLQHGKCACGCGQPLGTDYHLDHRMPLALGGSNTDDNMQLLRAKCNLQKHAKHPIEFMQSRGFLL